MAVDTSLFTDYSMPVIRLACKHAIMSGLVGGISLELPDGRSIGRYSLKEVVMIYAWTYDVESLEAAGDTGGGIAIVKYGERV